MKSALLSLGVVLSVLILFGCNSVPCTSRCKADSKEGAASPLHKERRFSNESELVSFLLARGILVGQSRDIHVLRAIGSPDKIGEVMLLIDNESPSSGGENVESPEPIHEAWVYEHLNAVLHFRPDGVLFELYLLD